MAVAAVHAAATTSTATAVASTSATELNGRGAAINATAIDATVSVSGFPHHRSIEISAAASSIVGKIADAYVATGAASGAMEARTASTGAITGNAAPRRNSGADAGFSEHLSTDDAPAAAAADGRLETRL